jgi:uncharacterized protein (TIGR02996 family)
VSETHPDWGAFRSAIEANPTDPAPRLVFADWLDDNHRPDEARIQRLASKVPVFTLTNELAQVVPRTGRADIHPQSPHVSVAYGSTTNFRIDRSVTRVEGNRHETRPNATTRGPVMSFSREHSREDADHDADVRRSVAQAMEEVVRRDPDHAERVLS